MAISLFRHNAEAYEAVLLMLAESDKAAVVHPTGTGKSFIGFKLCEDNPGKTICWASPSEYIFKTQIENLKAVSDGYEPENVKFFTYAKLMLMSKDELSEIKPEYIILDEFHRCGAEFWGQGIQNLLNAYPNVPILGLSATNIRYLDNLRDMADELFDGNIASEMTLGEAIVRGILTPPKYVLSVYSYQKDLERYQKRVYSAQNRIARDAAEKYLEALRRALEKADGLDVIFEKHIEARNGKYIVFCANKKHMDEMITHVSEWFGKIDSAPNVYIAYSSDPETSKAFAEFKADCSEHLKLLFCIDMLNEGIHVNDISGVILFRPTVSPIVYKQQIGRAMSASKKNGVVVFDIVNNISNLYSIGSIQEEISEAVEYLRFNGESDSIVNESFTIIDEVRDCIRLFDELEHSLAASWDYMYLEAKQYYEENGDLLPSAKYITPSGYNLGTWIVSQRGIYNGTHIGVLTNEQLEKLNQIGMCWLVAHERMWEKQYANAKAHFEATGKLLPPFKSASLKNWVISQRSKYNKHTLDDDKIKKLNAIGMVWDLDESWENMFRLATAYYNENGNLDIPANFVTADGQKLGRWYRRCVNENRKGLLSKERKNQLLQIGFSEEPIRVRTWMKYYAEAQKYRDQHGDLNVKSNYITENGLNLGIWLSSQRYSYNLGRLPRKRIELLEEIGMDWQRFDGKWLLGFSHFETYVKEFGHANVPYNYVSADGFKLGSWTQAQRNRKLIGKLSDEKIQKMEQLGWVWSVPDTAWENSYAAFAEFREKYGLSDIPADYMTPQGTSLKVWLLNQRSKFVAGKLPGWKVQKLNDIDPNWNKPRDNWDAMFECAKKFAEEHGSLTSVPIDYVSDIGINLHSWVVCQRKNIKNGKLSQERINKLKSVGFSLDPLADAWEFGYEHAKSFYNSYGHLNVKSPYCSEDGFRLGEWLRCQRRALKKGNMREDRKEKLDNIGMDWKQSHKNSAPTKVHTSKKGENDGLRITTNFKANQSRTYLPH